MKRYLEDLNKEEDDMIQTRRAVQEVEGQLNRLGDQVRTAKASLGDIGKDQDSLTS